MFSNTNSNRKASGSRPVSERTKRSSQNQQNNMTEKSQQRAKSSLLEREEEYKRLNAELEAKTAELVREAEAIMSEQENFLRSSPSQTPEKESTQSGNYGERFKNSRQSPDLESLSIGAKFGLLDLIGSDDGSSDIDERNSTARTSSRNTKSASSTRKTVSARQSDRKTIPTSAPRPATQSSKKSGRISRKQPRTTTADDVAIPDDFATKLNLDDAILNIEKNMGENFSARDIDDDDDIMPSAAVEMGSEAQIRFLKAKLRVMQEELERLSQECRSGAEDRKKMSLSLKEANEEQLRLQKTNNAQQTQIEKHKRLLEEEKKKSDSVGSQVQNLRKELDGLKREQKQSSVSHNATEVRLNRALEDAERYKAQLQKDKLTNKESSEHDRKEMDRLRSDNNRLERLKNDMSTVFKKQQKLISILKRQILHIEAAKLLSFTEEEFVKALDWGSK
ncbi:testis-expressed protein 9-like [Styela clava]